MIVGTEVPYSWFFFFFLIFIKYIIYFKYILNMDGLGRVGFDRFVILWPKPNSTRYKKNL